MSLEDLKAQFVGQEQCFVGVDKLDDGQKQELIANLECIDLDLVKKLYQVVQKSSEQAEGTAEATKLEPFENVIEVRGQDNSEREKWRQAGLGLISQGKAAALLMAGGQGTRLGSDAPKGQYNIGLPSGKSLFHLQAERLLSLKNLAAASSDTDASSFSLPWYIMTSPATHQPTVSFFTENNFFGYEKKDVFFFEQATLPCLSTDGKVLMESFTKPSRSPNGNGGIYAALHDSGALANMQERGVAEVFIYSVDNALCQVADPEFMGYCFLKNVDFGNKVLEKTDPKESVGVLAVKNGKNAVIEYSELPDDLAKKTNDSGSLQFRCANIAIHCMSVSFLVHAVEQDIPYHVAHKKIAVADENGNSVKPEKNNGVKLEKFIFDALALAKNPCAFMVEREGNFTAVKNAPGKGLPDSPDTARADVSAYHVKLIRAAGGSIKDSDDSNALCEISPLVSYNGENLEKIVKGQEFSLPLHLESK